jgi:PAS domain S-box-containing protein
MNQSAPSADKLREFVSNWIKSPIGRTLAESDLLSILITDENRRIVWANRAFGRISGHDPEEIIGMTPGSFMQGPGTDPASIQRLRQALDEGRSISQRILNYRKSGEPVWTELQIDPIRDLDGTLLGFLGSASDVTSATRLEEQLVRSYDLVQALEHRQEPACGNAAIAAGTGESRPDLPCLAEFDLPGASFQFTAEGGRLDWNYFPMNGARLLGLAPGDRPSDRIRACLGIFAKPHRRQILAKFRRSARDLTPLSFTCHPVQHEEVGERWLSISAAPRKLRGNCITWFGSVLDETQRVRAERVLEGKSRLLSLIVEITAEFLDSPVGRRDDLIDSALARIGSFFNVDRAFIFSYDFVSQTASNTHEWVSKGTEPFKDILQSVPVGAMPEWLGAHLAGRAVSIPDVSSHPVEATRKLLEMQGIKSVLGVPMMAEGGCVGFVGFDGVREARAFTEGEVELLRVFARNLVAFGDRCRVTEELETNERRLLDVIGTAGEYVWEIDREGALTYLSEMSEEAFRCAPDSLLGRSIASLAPDSARVSSEEWLESLMAEPVPFGPMEYFVALPGGRIGMHSLSGAPLLADDGSLMGYRGMGMDITGDRALSNRLRKAEDEIRFFFEASLDLLLICDGTGRIMRMSKSWEEAMAMPLAAMLGRNVLDFVAPDDRGRTEQQLSALKGRTGVEGYVNRWISGDGRSIYLEWTASWHGALLYCGARNVSLREEAEERMRNALEKERKSSEIKSRLVAMASHEFRTPIAAIRLAAEMIEARLDEGDEWTRAKLGTILSKSDFLESVVADILDLENLDRSGEGNDAPRPLKPLSEVVREVCEDFRQGPGHGGRLRFDFGLLSDLPVNGDLVGRVVRNLVENALKYSPKNEEVVVRAAPCALGASLSVIDRGPGIPEEEANEIFTVFFRGVGAEFVRGTGLGLTIAKKAANLLRGVLFYKRDPNGSTVFTLQFPAGPSMP